MGPQPGLLECQRMPIILSLHPGTSTSVVIWKGVSEMAHHSPPRDKDALCLLIDRDNLPTAGSP